MFKSKKHNKGANEKAVEPKNANNKAKAKKKKVGMAQIFKESVLDTILNDFEVNEQFIHDDKDGTRKYVALALDVTAIGGLDKRSNRDEAKGSIIECINSGKIKTFITDELMENDLLVLIPDADTLGAMDEFSLLTDTPYELCYVDRKGDVDLLNIKVSYADITEFKSSDNDISGLLGDVPEEEEEIETPDILADDEEKKDEKVTMADLFNDPLDDDDDEDIPGIGDDVDDFTDVDLGEDEEPSERYAMPTGVTPAEPAAEPEMVMPQEVEPENEIPAGWTEEARRRRFYAGDLDLAVTADPFDAQFMEDNPYASFDENRPGDTWLNNYLNEKAREANAEMQRIHQNNLFALRERYFRLISMQCDRIQKELDANNPETQYGQIKMNLDDEYEESRNQVDSIVARQKEELEATWKQKLQDIGMDAARQAQHNYRERYQNEHQQKIFDLKGVVESDIKAEHQYSIIELNDRRKQEAATLLDLSITEVLDEISQMYAESLKAENEAYKALQQELDDFRQKHIEEDVAYAQVRAEELRQTEQAEQVLAEQTAKIAAMSEEFSLKKKELHDEIDTLRKDNDARLERMKTDCDKDIAREVATKDELRERYDALLQSYEQLDKVKEAEFEERTVRLQDDLDRWEEKFNYVVNVHKKANFISVFFVIAALVASICIGYIGGEYINSSRNVDKQVQMIQSQYETTTDAVTDSGTSIQAK